MPPIKNISGTRSGRLFVSSEFKSVKSESSSNTYTYWKCKCDCGNEGWYRSNNLVRKETKSCGCILKAGIANYKHGFGGKRDKKLMRLYNSWNHMNQRCINPNDNAYHNYGGRGISVCVEWHSFIQFKNWALENGYANNLTLDRIHNDGNYEPSNCRWTTHKVQGNNRRGNRNIEYLGQTKTIAQWADHLGMGYHALYKAILRNKPVPNFKYK